MANYCNVVGFIKDPDTKKIIGANLVDELTGEQMTVRSKSIIFCGGKTTVNSTTDNANAIIVYLRLCFYHCSCRIV